MDSRQIKAAVVGATGYTGSELVRLLARHPAAHICAITSESSAGMLFSALYPQFTGIADIKLVTQQSLNLKGVDVVFLALPHQVSMEYMAGHDLSDTPVIDLSADFRIRSAATYSEWYDVEHVCPELIGEAVYGLPELYRSEIKSARLIANPGCYPTSAILPLSPLLKRGLIKAEGIVIDAKSGVTGAGNKARATTHFPRVNEGFAAYGLKRHRHTPEIEQITSEQAGQAVNLQFTPHLLPVNRGILSTIYARAAHGAGEAELQAALHAAYNEEPFVRVVTTPPSLDNVRGSNYCDIYATVDDRTGNALIVSVIDNLVKGAAGQAVQNMNIMFDIKETTGLEATALTP